jgi:hypothetical protein
MVGPKYSRPEVQVASDWLVQSKFVDKKDSIRKLQWFDIFKDTILNKLVSEALAKNYNMANAALRIEQSRAVYGIARADLLPSVGYSAKAELSNKSSETFGLGGTASWEIDFWGKLRHAKRAAYAEILASEEGMKTIQTILISDVASLYFQLRDLDNRLSIAKRTFSSRCIRTGYATGRPTTSNSQGNRQQLAACIKQYREKHERAFGSGTAIHPTWFCQHRPQGGSADTRRIAIQSAGAASRCPAGGIPASSRN